MESHGFKGVFILTYFVFVDLVFFHPRLLSTQYPSGFFVTVLGYVEVLVIGSSGLNGEK